jgi:hypothetical protein
LLQPQVQATGDATLSVAQRAAGQANATSTTRRCDMHPSAMSHSQCTPLQCRGFQTQCAGPDAPQDAHGCWLVANTIVIRTHEGCARLSQTYTGTHAGGCAEVAQQAACATTRAAGSNIDTGSTSQSQACPVRLAPVHITESTTARLAVRLAFRTLWCASDRSTLPIRVCVHRGRAVCVQRTLQHMAKAISCLHQVGHDSQSSAPVRLQAHVDFQAALVLLHAAWAPHVIPHLANI